MHKWHSAIAEVSVALNLVQEAGYRLPSSCPVSGRSQNVPFHDIKIVRATGLLSNRLPGNATFGKVFAPKSYACR
jgi:hypothetical protein